MNLLIRRCYHPLGTNGILTINEEPEPLCYTIELPWKDNRRRISCIPAGTYMLRRRYSPRFKWHLHVQDVPGRSLILFHPANNAILELQGCIAPVTMLTGEGRGDHSVAAFLKLMERVAEAFRRKESLLLTIGPAV